MNEKKIVEYIWCLDEFPSILLEFNKLRFNYSHFSQMWRDCGAADPIEFLPGIFYEEESGTPNLWKTCVGHILKFLAQKCRLPLPSKLKNIFLTTIRIQIINYRDTITLIINDTIAFSHTAVFDDQAEIDKYLEFKGGDNYTITFEQVPTDKILYPFTPGGDGDRCRIMKIFRALSLLNDDYPIFSKHEMFYTSAHSLNLINQCRKFPGCMHTLECYHNHTYKWPSEGCHNLDNLRLIEMNGIYKISNANHRICCAKRFDIPWVQAEVIHYAPSTPDLSQQVSTYRSPQFSSERKNLDVLWSYHHFLHKLELTDEDGRQLLRNGLRGNALLSYLENKLGTNLATFYQQLDHQPNDL